MKHGIGKVVRDPVLYGRKRQLVPNDLPIEAQHMDTEGRRDRHRAELLRFQREQKSLEFRYGLAGGDLAQVAALRTGRAG